MTMKISPFHKLGSTRAQRLTASAFAALLVCSASAAELATWNVSTLAGGAANYGPSPLSPTTSDANLTLTGFTRGSGVGTTGTAAGRAWGGNAWRVADAATAVAGSKFASFTVTPNSGYKVSFSSISKFDYRRSGSGATSGELQVDVGGGGFTTVTALSYPISTSGGASIAPINLSGVSSLQNVTQGTATPTHYTFLQKESSFEDETVFSMTYF